MDINKQGGVLVLFQNTPIGVRNNWWRQFQTLIAPRRLRELAGKHGLCFIDLDTLITAGSIEEACELVRKLSLLTDSAGRQISKIIKYKGFELWWVNYDNLMYKFCLPYTQYQPLLQYLTDFTNVCLFEPPSPTLFRYFLDSYRCQCIIKTESRFRRKLSIGILLQVVLSIPFLLWLKVRSPKLMLWTSDRFDPPRDHNFRMKFIYEKLRHERINFAEFIRSMEPSLVVLQHALKRKRPVVYSFAIITLAEFFMNHFGQRSNNEINNLFLVSDASSEQKFWFLVATNYLHDTQSDILAIRIIKLILKFIGIKVAIIVSAGSRNFPEVIACKLLGIPTIGMQHGFHSKYYFVSDFMHEFDGEKHLSVDKYGLWSEWWREYYLKHSRAYKPEQLFVSGLMRPLRRDGVVSSHPVGWEKKQLKILFVAEQLAAPLEVMPYLRALMEDKDLSFYIKFRSYHDGFEQWLNENHPEILAKMDQGKILKRSMHEAINLCDVVVGSHSTGVLESVLQLKPFVLFWTKKQGDYFALKPLYSKYNIFAENPKELVNFVKKSRYIPQDFLSRLQEEFFGDPFKDGSKWVVDQATEVFLNTRRH